MVKYMANLFLKQIRFRRFGFAGEKLSRLSGNILEKEIFDYFLVVKTQALVLCYLNEKHGFFLLGVFVST